MKNHIKRAMHKFGNYLVRKSGINENKDKYAGLREECYECFRNGAKNSDWPMPYNGLVCKFDTPKTVKVCPAQGKYIPEANKHRCRVKIKEFYDNGKITLDHVVNSHSNAQNEQPSLH